MAVARLLRVRRPFAELLDRLELLFKEFFDSFQRLREPVREGAFLELFELPRERLLETFQLLLVVLLHPVELLWECPLELFQRLSVVLLHLSELLRERPLELF